VIRNKGIHPYIPTILAVIVIAIGAYGIFVFGCFLANSTLVGTVLFNLLLRHDQDLGNDV